MPATWVYLLRCADDTIYCGTARNVSERVATHNAGSGAKYTRTRRPVRLLLARRCADQGTALRLEYAVKQLPRSAKLQLSRHQLSKMAAAIRRAQRSRV